MTSEAEKKLHYDVTFLGLRAQATAIGFLQLCIELKKKGILEDDAVGRIKAAIASELALARPKWIPRAKYMVDIERRLDGLFKGEEALGVVNPSSFGAPEEDG